MSKIFGIGLGRSGTTSLAHALTVLGYKTLHFPQSMEQIDRHEASDDLTVASRFKELDQKYPGSKFILTVRELDSWVSSCLWHYQKNWGGLTRPEPAKSFCMESGLKIYGAGVGRNIQPIDLVTGSARHLQDVMLYFRGREKDLLVLDIVGGDGWERLCKFLDKPTPNSPFPNSNKRRKT